MKFNLFGIKFNTLYVILIALVILTILYFCLNSVRESFDGANNGIRVLNLLSAQYTKLPTDTEIEAALGGKYPPQFKAPLTQAIYALHQATYGIPVITDSAIKANEVVNGMSKERQDTLMNILGKPTQETTMLNDENTNSYGSGPSMVIEETAPVEIVEEGQRLTDISGTSPVGEETSFTKVNTEGFEIMEQSQVNSCMMSLKNVNSSLSDTIDAMLALKGNSTDGTIPCGQDLYVRVKIDTFDENFNYFKTYCYAKAKPKLMELSGKLSQFPNVKQLVDQVIEYADNVMMYLTNFRKEFDTAAKCVDPPNKDVGNKNAPVGAASTAASATPLPSNSTCSAASPLVNASQNNTCNMQTATLPQTSCPAPVNTSQRTPCDNYNHFNNTSIPSMFYGPNGSIAKVRNNMDGRYTIIITSNSGENSIYTDNANNSTFGNSSPDKATYYGPKRTRAVFYTDNNGKKMLRVMYANGSADVYTQNNVEGYTNMKNGTEKMEVVDMNASNYDNAYEMSITTDEYQSSLPKGIPKYMIPPGQDDLYILKSEVVPPVCPACPPQILKCKNDTEVSKCPPCPPCARCPEPAFDCKKVPNYGSGNLGANYNNQMGAFGRMMAPDGSQLSLPQPVLNDYSTYGM